MLGAGTGLVYILRWYWWRINAWSEVSAMAAAFVVSLTLRAFLDADTATGFALNLIITTVATTIVWVAVTFATKPEPMATLTAFYARVRPAGDGWTPVAAAAGLQPVRGAIARNAAMWLCGVVLVYSIMFATGAILFHEPSAMAWLASTVVSASVLAWLFRGEHE
jgi:hypothetical protein